MSNRHTNCLNTSIPQTDETQIECTSFLKTSCVVEGDKTQEDINQIIYALVEQVQSLTAQVNQGGNVGDNKVYSINLGAIVTPIQTAFNALPGFTIGANDIYVIKATESGNNGVWLFAKGKGNYGTGGTTTVTGDFIKIN